MSTALYKSVPVGVFSSGLSTVNYQLISMNGGPSLSRSAIGVAEQPAGSSRYVAMIPFPAGFVGDLQWDDGGSPRSYFLESVDLSIQSAIQTRTNLIGSASVTFTSPVNADASATIVAGDDYLGARALSWSITNYTGPSLSGAVVAAGLMTDANYQSNASAGSIANLAGSVTVTTAGDSSTTAVITVPISSGFTSVLEPSPLDDPYNWVMQIVATTSDGHVQTLLLVALTVQRSIL